MPERGKPPATHHPNSATNQTEHQRLNHELYGNVRLGGSQCAADAYLLSAFGDGGQHDIHNANSTDQQ